MEEKEKVYAYLLRCPVALSDILAILEHVKNLLNGGLLFLELLHLQTLATSSRLLDKVGVRLLDKLNVLQAQLLCDDIQVTDGVDVTLNVDDLGIVKASDDLEDGIDGTDVRQESVTKTGTSGSTARQTSNVVDGQVGRYNRLGLVVLYQPVKALIGDEDARLFWVDGGIWEVLDQSA